MTARRKGATAEQAQRAARVYEKGELASGPAPKGPLTRVEFQVREDLELEICALFAAVADLSSKELVKRYGEAGALRHIKRLRAEAEARYLPLPASPKKRGAR